jgi:tetratricopeptide (TPR) repeat protein
MSKTKIVALLVLVVGTLLYLKTVLYPPAPPWEEAHQAGLTAYQGKNYLEAEKQFLIALKKTDKFLIDDWRLTQTLSNLAEIYRTQSKYSQATPYFKRLVEISEEIFEPDHPTVAAHLNNLAGNFRAQRMLVEAEPLYKRSLEIWEKNLGPDNSLVLFALKNYVDVLRELGRDAEVKKYQSRLMAAPPQ